MDDQIAGYMVFGVVLVMASGLMAGLLRSNSDRVSSYAEARGWPDTIQGTLWLLAIIWVIGLVIFAYGFGLLLFR